MDTFERIFRGNSHIHELLVWCVFHICFVMRGSKSDIDFFSSFYLYLTRLTCLSSIFLYPRPPLISDWKTSWERVTANSSLKISMILESAPNLLILRFRIGIKVRIEAEIQHPHHHLWKVTSMMSLMESWPWRNSRRFTATFSRMVMLGSLRSMFSGLLMPMEMEQLTLENFSVLLVSLLEENLKINFNGPSASTILTVNLSLDSSRFKSLSQVMAILQDQKC